MTKTTSFIIKCLLVAAALIITINFGCEMFPESSFELAPESRLPKWIQLPPGLTRSDVSLTMDYYIKPWGGSAGFFLRDKKGRILKKQVGRTRCTVPFELENPPRGYPKGYPAYEPITVNETTEIIEHRKMEPIFYVSDDTAVWDLYKSIKC